MDILKMLADLRAEREQIEQAIVTIERLAVGPRGKRRGRPPAWMSVVDKSSPAKAVPGKKRTITAAGRKRLSDAMKKRWAEKKAQASKAESKA